MAEEKAGCLTWVLVAVGFIPGAIMGAFIPEWLHIVALVVSVIVVLICSVMVAVNKKPEFEDETFGHACKRFMWESLGQSLLALRLSPGSLCLVIRTNHQMRAPNNRRSSSP